ncbi:MAG TPA: HAD-IA family hydrolase, partial [Victivallales bacterium]|nr:HAD-IA family hydrolase [Victivallales bacterium]
MKGIVFCDLDGTLIDSRKDLANAVNFARKRLSLKKLPVEEIISYVGNGVKKLLERSFYGTNVNTLDALFIMKEYYSEHLLDNTKLYDGVSEGLDIIKKSDFALVLLSNKIYEHAIEILKSFELYNKFNMVIADNGTIPLKPAPDAVFLAIEKLKISKDFSWIIGDNWTDILCGRNAGIKTAFASYGFGRLNGEKFDFFARNFLHFAE